MSAQKHSRAAELQEHRSIGASEHRKVRNCRTAEARSISNSALANRTSSL